MSLTDELVIFYRYIEIHDVVSSMELPNFGKLEAVFMGEVPMVVCRYGRGGVKTTQKVTEGHRGMYL